MCGCQESSNSDCQLRVFELADLNMLAGNVSQSFSVTSRDARYPTVDLFTANGSLGVATTAINGESGEFTFPFIGIPVTVKWKVEIESLSPKLNVTLKLAFYVAGASYYSVDLHVECDNITDPSSCSVEIKNEDTHARGIRGCNKSCLKRCAPDCILCGGNWQCWAICSAYCAAKCCF